MRKDIVLRSGILITWISLSGPLVASAQQASPARPQDPDSTALSTFNLAEGYHAQGKYAAEMYYLRRTLALTPSRDLEFRARLELAAELDKMGNADQALAELLKLVAAFPASAEAHNNLGNEYARQVRLKEAAGEYQQALRIDAGFNAARLSLAKADVQMGETAPAISRAQEYIRRDPGDSEGFFVMGQAYRLHSDYSGAEPEFRQALRLQPDYYDARYALGEVLAKSGKIQEAIADLEEAKKLNPDAPAVHYELSSLYARQGKAALAKQEADAFRRCQETVERAGAFARLRSQGDALLRKGSAQAAADAYREAIQKNPQDPAVHYDLALALSDLGDKAEERRELEEAAALGPTLPEPHNRLGAIDLADGKTSEAEKELESALALNPALVEAMNNLGVLYQRRGDMQAALQEFREAIRIDPGAADVHANLGLVLAASGEFAEAERELHEALRLDPGNRAARSGLDMLQTRTN